MVGCRKGDGHGDGYGHGHVQRTFEQILQTLQLALPIANAVFQCGHMMANRNRLDERQRKLRAEGSKERIYGPGSPRTNEGLHTPCKSMRTIREDTL